ncbi:MAG: hypothetical protein OPY09_03550 [Nitrosopumilus sp.]|nr:hypothetical protein [Nitrosopumilus sp.]
MFGKDKEGYKPWKDYGGANALHNQPIHSGGDSAQPNIIDEKKHGFMHMARIDQKFADMHRKHSEEARENRHSKEANRAEKAKERQQRMDAIELEEQQEQFSKKMKEDLRKGRISMRDYKDQMKMDNNLKKQGALPKDHSGSGNASERDKKRIEDIQKDIRRINNVLHGNPNSKDAEEGLESLLKTNPELTGKVHILQQQVSNLRTEEEKLKFGSVRGFNGIGGFAKENYKGQILPTANREHQERQFARDQEDQKGSDEFNVLFKNEDGRTVNGKFYQGNSAQKKRKELNPLTGKWEWTSEMTDYQKQKFANIENNKSAPEPNPEEDIITQSQDFRNESYDNSHPSDLSNYLIIGQGRQ